MNKLILSISAMAILTIGQFSHADHQTKNQTQINTTLNKIITLAEQGEQMNLKKTAQIFNEPDLFSTAVFKGSDYNSTVRNHYVFKQKDSPLKEVNYAVELDMDAGFSKVEGSVEFEFKKEQCPTIADYEKATGTKAMATQIPTSPSLITGRGGSYTAHFISTKQGKSLMVVACRVSIGSEAKLS